MTCTDEEKEFIAAKKIQRSFRFFSSKKYRVPPLAHMVKPSLVLCAGNDPNDLTIDSDLLTDMPFALVGTSCLRSLDIAASFCKTGSKHEPKIYIVDINPNVKIFWNLIKELFKTSDSVKSLFENLSLNQDRLLKIINANYIKEITKMMEAIIVDIEKRFSFDYIKKMVQKLTCLTHDWADPVLFVVIKNICKKIGLPTIYAYTSNILSCMDPLLFDSDVSIKHILDNIGKLNPCASVYSNCDFVTSRPTKIISCAGVGDITYLRGVLGMHSSLILWVGKYKRYIKEKCSRGEFNEAVTFANKGIRLSKSIPTDENIIFHDMKLSIFSDFSFDLGCIYQKLGHLHSALLKLSDAEDVRLKINHPELIQTRCKIKEIESALFKKKRADFIDSILQSFTKMPIFTTVLWLSVFLLFIFNSASCFLSSNGNSVERPLLGY